MRCMIVSLCVAAFTTATFWPHFLWLSNQCWWEVYSMEAINSSRRAVMTRKGSVVLLAKQCLQWLNVSGCIAGKPLVLLFTVTWAAMIHSGRCSLGKCKMTWLPSCIHLLINKHGKGAPLACRRSPWARVEIADLTCCTPMTQCANRCAASPSRRVHRTPPGEAI